MEDYDRCKHLYEHCKGCNRFFRKDERYFDCPDCGTSRRCRSYPVKGTDLCASHGGLSNPEAKYVPNPGRPLVTGKNSSSALTRLAAKYNELQSNGPLQSLRPALKVVDERIIALLGRIEENYSPNRIKTIMNAWTNLNASVPGLKDWVKQNKSAAAAYHTLESENKKAYHDYESWNQIMAVLDLRRKLSADEMRILEKMQAMISAEDAYDLVAQLLAVILRVMKEEPNGSRIIKTIQSEFSRIIGEPYLDRIERSEPEIIDIDTRGMGGAELLYSRDLERPGVEGEDTTPAVSEGLPE